MAATDDPSSTGLHAVARDYADGMIVGEHCHIEGQFVHATTGVMEIRAAEQLWLIPPQRALWIPPRLPHTLRARGGVSLRTLYVVPGLAVRRLGDTPCGFLVQPLLRALILRALDPCAQRDMRRFSHLATVLIDELCHLTPAGISLAMPSDPRLARICADILARPGEEHRVDSLARTGGASMRTFRRLALDELGCPISVWRQQARVLAALPMLATGESIIRVAHALGYASPGAFSSMFKRVIGVSPHTYRSFERDRQI